MKKVFLTNQIAILRFHPLHASLNISDTMDYTSIL